MQIFPWNKLQTSRKKINILVQYPRVRFNVRVERKLTWCFLKKQGAWPNLLSVSQYSASPPTVQSQLENFAVVGKFFWTKITHSERWKAREKCVHCYVVKRKKKLEGIRLLGNALTVEGKWKQLMLRFNGDFAFCPYVSHSRGSIFVLFVQGVWFWIIIRIRIKDQFQYVGWCWIKWVLGSFLLLYTFV